MKKIVIGILTAGVLLVIPSGASAFSCRDALVTSSVYMHDNNMRHGAYCWNWSDYGRDDQGADDEIAQILSYNPTWSWYSWGTGGWHPNNDPNEVDEYGYFLEPCPAHPKPSGCEVAKVFWARGSDANFVDSYHAP